MPEQAPAQPDLFSRLTAAYGVNAALTLMKLFDPNASTASKGFAGVSAASTGANAVGTLTGTPALGAVGKGLGTAASLAGLGYNISQVAGDESLSTKQKAGASGNMVADALISAFVPYGWLYAPTKAVGGIMQNSGSPQIREGGRQILAPLLPVTSLSDVLSAKKSPRAAAQGVWDSTLDIFGMGHKPTTGTMFRDELSRVMGQIAPLKGTDTSRYTLPTGGYEAFSPDANSAAINLGKLLAPYAKDSATNPDGYALQARNILLNTHGNNLPSLMPSILQLLQKS